MVDKSETGWCSWCFKETSHELVQQNYARRNVYQCRMCVGRTLFCRKCKSFARGHETYDDEFCAKCDNTVTDWGQRPTDVLGQCSWCFEETAHRLIQKNSISRDVSECTKCGRRTLRCRKCEDAFARGHGTYDDERCIVCDLTIKGWDDCAGFELATMKTGWCSWCFDRTKHKLEQVNPVRRNVYTCEDCGARTLPCSACKGEFARGGPGWDDQHCAHCAEEVKDWAEFKKSKDAFVARPYAIEEVKKQLTLETEERKKALEAGLIRPFLLLVSMDYANRNQVAAALGFSLFNQPYLGDCHKEAWDILDSKVKGIRRRATESWETINPIASNANWYETVYRVGTEMFKKLEAEDLSFSKSIIGCRSRNWPPIQRIEEEFIQKLNFLQAAQLTAEQLVDLDKIVDSDEVRELAKRLKDAGFETQGAIRYGVNTTYQAIRLGGFNSYIWTVKIAGAMNRRLGTKIVMSQATKNVARFASALNWAGWLWLAVDVIELAAGSSHGRLIPAIVPILTQRIWLAGEGVRIEDYY